MPTKAEIQAELDALKAEHERLKVTVVETARRYAEDHDWCSVVDEALEEMGLEMPPELVTVQVTFDARQFAKAHEIPVDYNDIERIVYGQVATGPYGENLRDLIVDSDIRSAA